MGERVSSTWNNFRKTFKYVAWKESNGHVGSSWNCFVWKRHVHSWKGCVFFVFFLHNSHKLFFVCFVFFLRDLIFSSSLSPLVYSPFFRFFYYQSHHSDENNKGGHWVLLLLETLESLSYLEAFVPRTLKHVVLYTLDDLMLKEKKEPAGVLTYHPRLFGLLSLSRRGGFLLFAASKCCNVARTRLRFECGSFRRHCNNYLNKWIIF